MSARSDARAARRWPLTSVTAALGAAALSYVVFSPSPEPAPAPSVGEGLESEVEAIRLGAPDFSALMEVPEVSEVPPPSTPTLEDASTSGASIHRGEEGKMGKPSSKSRTGLYALKGPKDAVPAASPEETVAEGAGVLGALEAGSGHALASPHGGAFAVGEDEDVWGGLTGDEVGESYGAGGLGLVGTGRGGGGTGEGTIGLGSHGVIGKGGGGGVGAGYGRGPSAGRAGYSNRLQARTLTVGTVDDFSDPRAWREATSAMSHEAAALGITDEWLGLVSPGQRHVARPDALDIALVLDTTGSMSDELEYLKVELRDIAREVAEANPGVDQRWGLVVYRDQGDAYVTRTTDLGGLDAMIDALGSEHAGGGGDFPEAMDRALEQSQQMSWRQDRQTARMVFLVADAPPHAGEAASRFLDAIRGHRNAETAIYPVSGSGVDDRAEIAMRVAARATGGQYIYLTDHSGIGGTHKKPHTPETKIESLHDVMIRLISEELGGEAPRSERPPEPPISTQVDPAGPAPELEPSRPTDEPSSKASASEAGVSTLRDRLAEHFLFAMGVTLAVFAAMGIDTFRRRRTSRQLGA